MCLIKMSGFRFGKYWHGTSQDAVVYAIGVKYLEIRACYGC